MQTNELAAVIYQHIIEDVPDGLARETAWMDHLVGEGKIKQPGGLYIQFPIKLIANSAQGYISGTGSVVNTNPSQQLQYGILNWKYYNFNVNFTIQDFNVAQGKSQAVEFMATKVEGATNDSTREISLSMHSSSIANPLNVEGLKDVVAASGTTYAGLLDTDYPAKAYLPYIATDTTLNYTNVNKLIMELRARMRSQKKKNKRMLGLANQASYARFLNSVQNQQRFGVNELMAKTGFEGFYVNNIEFYLDADVPGSQDGVTGDNYVYIFPTDIMKMYYNYGFGNKSPFDGHVQLPNQPIMSIQSYMTFNLVCTNRRLIAVNKTFIA